VVTTVKRTRVGLLPPCR